MIQVPLPRSIKGSQTTPKLREYPYNLIYSQGALLSRPACEKVADAHGQPRGFFEWEDTLYSVFGQKLYSGTTSITEVGDLKGSGKISTARGFYEVAIATGNTNYKFNGTLSTIADPDLPVCSSVARVDSRFVWVPSDGLLLFYSEVGDAADVDALSTFDAETLPDGNRLALNIKNDLFIAGDDSWERFRNVGSSNQPFKRVNNSIISVGYVGGIVETRDSFMFLGKDKDGGYQFYIFANGTAVPISTDPVNEVLNTTYTKEQLETVSGQRFNWRGVDCYVFTMPDRDFVFSGGNPSNWGYFGSGTPDPLTIPSWGYQNAKLFNDTWYVQKSDGLYKLTADSTDTAGDFGRGFKTYARTPDERVVTLNRLELAVAQNIEAGSVGLSMSRDGQLWSDFFYRETGGQYDNRLVFQPLGGLGLYDGYIGMFIYTTQDVPFSVENMTIMT